MLLKIEIVYCAVWHYTNLAVGLAADLLKEFEPQIETLTLVPSDGGRYEITVNENLIYSKLKTLRHAEQGEVLQLVREFLKS